MEKLRRYINRIKAAKHGMDPTAKSKISGNLKADTISTYRKAMLIFLPEWETAASFPG